MHVTLTFDKLQFVMHKKVVLTGFMVVKEAIVFAKKTHRDKLLPILEALDANFCTSFSQINHTRDPFVHTSSTGKKSLKMKTLFSR